MEHSILSVSSFYKNLRITIDVSPDIYIHNKKKYTVYICYIHLINSRGVAVSVKLIIDKSYKRSYHSNEDICYYLVNGDWKDNKRLQSILGYNINTLPVLNMDINLYTNNRDVYIKFKNDKPLMFTASIIGHIMDDIQCEIQRGRQIVKN